MGYEVTRDLPLEPVPIETPIGPAEGQRIAGRKIVIVPVLRAGLGMLDGMLKLILRPGGRDRPLPRPEDAGARGILLQAPDTADRDFIVVDPMLATGGSSAAAITMLKKRGVQHIKLMCLVSAPEGVECVSRAHPDVEIYTAALDDHLNEHGYIVPGLGDAGDRIFGTK